MIADIDKYVEHVEMHLAKENQRLFVMADMILSHQSKEIDLGLDLVEKIKLGDLNQSRQHYEKIVDNLTTVTKWIYLVNRYNIHEANELLI